MRPAYDAQYSLCPVRSLVEYEYRECFSKW